MMKRILSTTGVALVLTAGSAPAPALLVAQPAPDSARALSLAEAVGVALARSHEVDIASHELAESGQRTREARGTVLPQVEVRSTYTRNLEVPRQFLPARLLDPDAAEGELIPLRLGFDNMWFGQLRVEQPLFQPGLLFGIGAAARYEALKAEELRGTRHDVVTRVREAYYLVLLRQESMRVTRTSLERVEHALEEARALRRAGQATEYDVLRLEVELARLEPRLRRAQSELASARRALGVTLGLDGGREVAVQGSLASLSLDDAAANDADNAALLSFSGVAAPESVVADALIAQARTNRTDLRQLARMKRLRATEVRYERASSLPQLSLIGSYSITGQDDGAPSFFGSGQRIRGSELGLQVSVPVFTGLQNQARVQQKQALYRQAEAQERLAAARAENEVRTLLDGVHEARDRVHAQRRAIDLARKGWDIARVQHREGVGNQLALTDAEVALRESEFDYAQAVYDYLVVRARLDEAVGVVPRVDTDPARAGT